MRAHRFTADWKTGWQRPVEIPEHAHPLVREFVRIANQEQATLKEIAQRAGLNQHTLKGWRLKHMPQLDTFEAALNVLDHRLLIKPRGW